MKTSSKKVILNLSPEVQKIINYTKQGTNLTTSDIIEIIIKQYFSKQSSILKPEQDSLVKY